ncbi:protein of unknown function [Vibrio tapetis subsp. tapetis]|uniref:Uncharacterized protein n=1 Tax=Vibrio tapetis subsp. tapetis TaxID=1671868 RepID=A0A2N8ZJG5_9VIBR|nr:protein of unknown function [Vibrio tapetis subsp. tapetis]
MANRASSIETTKGTSIANIEKSACCETKGKLKYQLNVLQRYKKAPIEQIRVSGRPKTGIRTLLTLAYTNIRFTNLNGDS